MNFKSTFKNVSDMVQFLASFITLATFISTAPKIPILLGKLNSNTPSEVTPDSISGILGSYHTFFIFAITFCIILILWNVFFFKLTFSTRFTSWRRLYRSISYMLMFLLVEWTYGILYKIFWGGAILWRDQELHYLKTHFPYCFYYFLICLAVGVGTLFRITIHLEENEIFRLSEINSRKIHSHEVWEQGW